MIPFVCKVTVADKFGWGRRVTVKVIGAYKCSIGTLEMTEAEWLQFRKHLSRSIAIEEETTVKEETIESR